MEKILKNYIIPSNIGELKDVLSEFLESPLTEITLESKKMSITKIVEEAEKFLEKKDYKVRILTKGTAAASVLSAFSTGGLSLVAKAAHLVATYDPEFEIRRNFITGNVDIVKTK